MGAGGRASQEWAMSNRIQHRKSAVMQDYTHLLPTIADIARRAGAAIMEVYRTDFDVERKDDGSPLTLADTASEAVILPALAALTPDIPIVSEESAETNATPDRIGNRFWLVDPLDGTREFLKRNDEFCVAIGLIDDGVPVLGVLHGPALDVTYAAAGPGTATRAWGGGAPQPISCRTPPADGIDVLASRSHRVDADLETFLAAYTVRERVPQGSALKFGRIAAGEVDLYPRLGPTMEWDTAGGHAIVLAAGGSVLSLDEKFRIDGPLQYAKPKYLNGNFLVAGRPA
jgi:3'(2'), 5'-bisphosphate nucleotidase